MVLGLEVLHIFWETFPKDLKLHMFSGSDIFSGYMCKFFIMECQFNL